MVRPGSKDTAAPGSVSGPGVSGRHLRGTDEFSAGQLPELLQKREEFLERFRDREQEYEHLLVYFTYRYFMEALFDGCVLPPARFAAASLLVIQLMDTELWLRRGDFSPADRIFTAKLYSKEIEYCPENMEAIRKFLE